MNALELANDLKSDIFKIGHSITSYHIAKLDEAAAMLRQLQAEIAELKHINRNWKISEEMAYSQIEQQQAEIEALKASNNILKTELINKDMGYK